MSKSVEIMEVCGCCFAAAENGGRHGTACDGLHEHSKSDHPRGLDSVGAIPAHLHWKEQDDIPFHAVGRYRCDSCGRDMEDGEERHIYEA